jgi:hypothetical protein
MLFRDEAFRKWLGLDKVITVEGPWLNPGGFIIRRREAHRLPCTLTSLISCWCPAPPQLSSSKKPNTDEASKPQPLELGTKINLFSLWSSLLQVFHYSNENRLIHYVFKGGPFLQSKCKKIILYSICCCIFISPCSVKHIWLHFDVLVFNR